MSVLDLMSLEHNFKELQERVATVEAENEVLKTQIQDAEIRAYEANGRADREKERADHEMAERGRADQEKERADKESWRADQEEMRANQEKERADKEKERADKEKERADKEKERADKEKESADLWTNSMVKFRVPTWGEDVAAYEERVKPLEDKLHWHRMQLSLCNEDLAAKTKEMAEMTKEIARLRSANSTKSPEKRTREEISLQDAIDQVIACGGTVSFAPPVRRMKADNCEDSDY